MFSFLKSKRQKQFSEIIEDRHIEIAQKTLAQIDKAYSLVKTDVCDFRKSSYLYEYAFGAFSSATMDFPKVKLNKLGIRILEHACILFFRDILRQTDMDSRLLFQTCLIMVEANPDTLAFVNGQKDGVLMINGSTPDTLFRYLFERYYKPIPPSPGRK